MSSDAAAVARSGTSDRLAAVVPGEDDLFTYGTLLFPDVLTALLGRVPLQRRAECPGWRVAELVGRVYPGLVATDRGTAQGQLLTELSPAEWRLVDAFEDPRYRLRAVTPSGGGSAAWAYEWVDIGDASPQAWDQQHFIRNHLPAYAARCAVWSNAYHAACDRRPRDRDSSGGGPSL